jgi:hypothetical protein
MTNERVCEICGKTESEWDRSEFIFFFAFTLKDSDKEMYYCPSCLLMRFTDIAKMRGDEDNE